MAERPARDDLVEAQIVEWITRHIGPVSTIVRQERWRASWFVNVKTAGAPLKLYVRASRGGAWPPMPLRYEYDVHRLFLDEGLKAAPLHGYIEELPAIVMEVLPGRANMRTLQNAEHRASLHRQLAEQMARMHAIDPAKLRAIGAHAPSDPLERALAYYNMSSALYERGKTRPAPHLEFLRGWMARHPPAVSATAEVIAVDAGQFMFDGDQLTGLIDFEMVALGDRYTDLGALRTRDRHEYIGDLDEFYALYASIAGIRLDYDRIRYHALAISMLAPMMTAEQLTRPSLDQDYAVYLEWFSNGGIDSLEQLHEFMGVALEEWRSPVEGQPGRYDDAFADLALWLDAGALKPGFTGYEMAQKRETLRILRRVHAYQPQFDQDYFNDIAELLNERPREWREADAKLEQFVHAAGPEHDVALARLFHRQIRRHAFLVDDPAAPRRRYHERVPRLKGHNHT